MKSITEKKNKLNLKMMEGEHERNEIKLYLTTDLQNQFLYMNATRY